MEIGLYNIKLFNDGQLVYDENQPWAKEPDDIDIGLWMAFIRPHLRFSPHILICFIRNLKPNEI